MPEPTLAGETPRVKRDRWTRDGKLPGIYFCVKADSSKSWGYYADGRIQSVPSRQDAIDSKAKAGLRKSAGLPAPDTRVLIRDLAEEVRETKSRKLRGSSFKAFEYALDKIILPEVGHLKPGACGPDCIAQLIRDLQDRGLGPASIRRYLTPLAAIYKLAIRRGIVPSSPLTLLGDDERALGGGVSDHHEWTTKEISDLIGSAEYLGRQPESRYDYAPLIRVLVTLGLRVSEALALRKCDVDLLGGVLHIRHTWPRDGKSAADLTEPKTKAGKREVPLSPGIVNLFLSLIPVDADEGDFVFSTTKTRPISYWNFEARGFKPALELAELSGKGITIHTLRSAAISLYAARGLTLVEVAEVMGQADPLVTWKHYARLFDRSEVASRIRDAQASLDGERMES
jgi:integrase